MKLKKIIPTLGIASIACSVVPVIASCSQKDVKITIEEKEKNKKAVVFWRETEDCPYYTPKTETFATYSFQLTQPLSTGTRVLISDIVTQPNETIENITVNDMLVVSGGTLLEVDVILRAKEGKSIKVNDEFKFGFTIQTENHEIKPTKIDNLSLKMIDVPCDIYGPSVLDKVLTGTYHENMTDVTVEGMKIDQQSFYGYICFYNGFESKTVGSTTGKNYTLSIKESTQIIPSASNAEGANVKFDAELSEAIDPTDGDVTFTATECTLSVLFIPYDTQICRYISTMSIPIGHSVSIKVTKAI